MLLLGFADSVRLAGLNELISGMFLNIGKDQAEDLQLLFYPEKLPS